MILDIDLVPGRPLYLQIAAAIRGGLAAGSIAPGDRLPPGRELAASLDVNLETVQRAYRLLANDGIVTSRVGRGTRVAASIDPDRLRVDDLVDDLVDQARRIGMKADDLQAAVIQRWAIRHD